MEYGKLIAGIFVTSIMMTLAMILTFGFLSSSNTSSLSANQTAQLNDLKNVSGYGGIIASMNKSYSSTFGNGNTNSLSGIFTLFSQTFIIFGGIIWNVFGTIILLPQTILVMANIMIFGSSLPLGGISGIIISYVVGVLIIGLVFEIVSYLGKWQENNQNVS